MFKSTLNFATKKLFTTKTPFLLHKLKHNTFATIQGLKKILKEEIEHEEKNYSSVDANDLKTFLDKSKFQFIDKPDLLSMELRKTHGNYDIVVNFQAKPPQEAETESQDGKDEEKSMENFNEFIVRLTKRGSKSGLLVMCVAVENVFEINNIYYSEDVNGLFSDIVNQKASDVYNGPDFTTLDERLQSEFNDFLADVGINEDFVQFINVLSVDKDQRLYSIWLKNLDKFFNH